MALPADTIWEVRASGADTNGGGRKSTASADLTLQDAAAYSVTDGVTAGTTTITSATANFGTDVVDHMVYVQGGTGSVSANWYHIVSRTNATTIVVERSTGLTAGTGVTLKIGGAFASPGQAMANFVAGNILYIKYSASPYLMSGSANTSGGPISLTVGSASMIFGYDSTRTPYNTDASRPTLKANASSLTLVSQSGTRSTIGNLVLDGNSQTTSIGLSCSGFQGMGVSRVKVMNTTSKGITDSVATLFEQIEVTGCSGTVGFEAISTHIVDVANIHDNTTTGMTTSSGNIVLKDIIFAANTGASSDGLVLGNLTQSISVTRCTFRGNGRHGINRNPSFADTVHASVHSCVFAENSGYGIGGSSTSDKTSAYRNCAFYNNTSGQIQNSSSIGAVSGTVTLSGDPFVNAAAGNFALNNTSGAGAACRAAGIPGAFPGGTTTGYLDIGAVQHQDSGGGGGPLIGPGRLVRC